MGKPWVVAHNVASLDGRLTLAPGVLLLHGDPRWSAIAGQADPYARLRATYEPDAILEGSGSFVAEGDDGAPLPDVLAADAETLHRDHLPPEVVGRDGHRGWFTVVDGRGRIRWMFKEWPDPAWSGWHVLVLVCQATPAAYLAYLRAEGIPYLVAGTERVDLRAALERLSDRLGVERVVSTGGARLQCALVRAGLIDEIDIELLPAVIGGAETPSLFGGRPLDATEQPAPLTITEATVDDGRVRIRAIVRPAS